ncbi:carbohydrate kinase [cyanobiont of Ornithocercus magnificus]|nr:carbohydrate kinase [cyanobiont of Ornithocercus magnificus]
MQSIISQAPQVLCLGEALIDRLGSPGSDPAFDRSAEDWLGGAPANVACGLARLGTTAAFIGRLGEDKTAVRFRRLFAERGVNLEALQYDATRPSRIVLVRRHTNGERVFQGFVGDCGAGFSDQALSLSALQPFWPNLASGAHWLLVGTISLASLETAKTLCWCVEQAVMANLPIALDVNWRPTFWDAEHDPNAGPDIVALKKIQLLLKAVSLLKLTKEEAIWLCGTDNPRIISNSLPQQPDVVITNGERPVRWKLGLFQGMTDITAPRHIIDTTGAGDAFMAGLLHQLTILTRLKQDMPSLRRDQVEAVIHYAAACGALVCSGPGGIDPQPFQSHVRNFLDASGICSCASRPPLG